MFESANSPRPSFAQVRSSFNPDLWRFKLIRWEEREEEREEGAFAASYYGEEK